MCETSIPPLEDERWARELVTNEIKSYHVYLVGGLEHVLCFHSSGNHHPNPADELIFFIFFTNQIISCFEHDLELHIWWSYCVLRGTVCGNDIIPDIWTMIIPAVESATDQVGQRSLCHEAARSLGCARVQGSRRSGKHGFSWGTMGFARETMGFPHP